MDLGAHWALSSVSFCLLVHPLISYHLPGSWVNPGEPWGGGEARKTAPLRWLGVGTCRSFSGALCLLTPVSALGSNAISPSYLMCLSGTSRSGSSFISPPPPKNVAWPNPLKCIVFVCKALPAPLRTGEMSLQD